MNHRVEFRPGAIDQVAEFAKADPDGIRALLDRLDLLAGEPAQSGRSPTGPTICAFTSDFTGC